MYILYTQEFFLSVCITQLSSTYVSYWHNVIHCHLDINIQVANMSMLLLSNVPPVTTLDTF
jgi:hypothetical protein